MAASSTVLTFVGMDLRSNPNRERLEVSECSNRRQLQDVTSSSQGKTHITEASDPAPALRKVGKISPPTPREASGAVNGSQAPDPNFVDQRSKSVKERFDALHDFAMGFLHATAQKK